jgi:hypothetical protein
MERHQKKISITISPELVSDLDLISRRLGVSRSALISEILSEPVRAVAELFGSIPENPTPVDVLRFRGDSQGLVRERVEQLNALANDLFSDTGAPK